MLHVTYYSDWGMQYFSAHVLNNKNFQVAVCTYLGKDFTHGSHGVGKFSRMMLVQLCHFGLRMELQIIMQSKPVVACKQISMYIGPGAGQHTLTNLHTPWTSMGISAVHRYEQSTLSFMHGLHLKQAPPCAFCLTRDRLSSPGLKQLRHLIKYS